MKKVLFLLAMFSCIGAQAQITLTQNEMPGIGDVFVQFVDTTPASTYQQIVFETGTNYTWDFDTLGTHDTIGFIFIDPDSTAYASLFPNADICIQIGDSSWAYFAVDASKAEILGVIGYIDTTEFKMVYSNTDEIYQFPYTMGTCFWDMYSGSFTFYLGVDPGTGFTVDSIRYTETHYENQSVVGWGTVITPNGNFDVLKTVIIDTAYTTVDAYVYGTWINYINDTSITCTFQWNMRNTGVPLIEAEFSIVDSTIYEIRWLNVSPSLSIEEVNALNMEVYPNPTTDVLNIEIPELEHYYLRITDVQGRIILETSEIEGSKTTISLNGIDNGTYFVTAIMNDQIIGTRTFVKE